MSKPQRIEPEVKSNPREDESLPKAKRTAPGINSTPSKPDKRGLQIDSAKAEKEFNRGAKKPWVPKGGRAPQPPMKVAPPKEAPLAKGPGYSGKGYTKK